MVTHIDKKAEAAASPPPPEKPDPNECCGSGCVPCIYDYYYDRLSEWEQKYGKLNKKSHHHF
ncbi:MAG: hypothetical protein ACI9FR_002344 [Cryomorphaceae bacterium]